MEKFLGIKRLQNLKMYNFSDIGQCIWILIIFKSNLCYYLVQIYIPSTIIIFMAWIPYWINQECVAVRLMLSITTLISMKKLDFSQKLFLTGKSSINEIYVWFIMCYTFIVSNILIQLLYMIANYTAKFETMFSSWMYEKNKKVKCELDPKVSMDNSKNGNENELNTFNKVSCFIIKMISLTI